jgi:hypothetical protein
MTYQHSYSRWATPHMHGSIIRLIFAQPCNFLQSKEVCDCCQSKFSAPELSLVRWTPSLAGSPIYGNFSSTKPLGSRRPQSAVLRLKSAQCESRWSLESTFDYCMHACLPSTDWSFNKSIQTSYVQSKDPQILTSVICYRPLHHYSLVAPRFGPIPASMFDYM